MKITAERLPALLAKNLAPIYWVSSDEPLLQEEACAQIRLAAQRADYHERQRFTVSNHFDWQSLREKSRTLSLFSQKRLFELDFPSGKPGDAGSKALQAYAAAPPADTILLIYTGKLTVNTQTSLWYKAIEKIGVIVHIWPIETAQLPQWISQRLKQKGLQITTDAAALLAEYVEGNLLAAAQEIEKLQLLFTSGPLELQHITEALSDLARFDVFKWADQILKGDGLRVLRMLRGLQQEATEPTLLLWVLTRELRQLINVAHAYQAPHSLDQVLQKLGIWEKRKSLYKCALPRHTLQRWQQLLMRAGDIDQIIKGIRKGQVWDELQQLSLTMAGVHA